MATKKIKNEIILLRVTPEQKKKWQALADKAQRTLSDFIRITIDNLTDKK